MKLPIHARMAGFLWVAALPISCLLIQATDAAPLKFLYEKDLLIQNATSIG